LPAHGRGKGLEGSGVDGHRGGGLRRRHGPAGLGTRPLLLCQHLLEASSCSWRGAVQPVQAFPPPRSRRPSRCHRLGFI
jgi:hypothetical protein